FSKRSCISFLCFILFKTYFLIEFIVKLCCTKGPVFLQAVLPCRLVKHHSPFFLETPPCLTSIVKNPSFGAKTRKSSSPDIFFKWWLVNTECKTYIDLVEPSSLNLRYKIR